jgi:hypothetical protein
MPTRPAPLSVTGILLVCLFLSACTNPSGRTVHDKSGRPASTGRIKQVPQTPQVQHPAINWPSNMRRLAVLPVDAARPVNETQRDMDGVFRGELSKVVKYEIVQVGRPEMLALIGRESVSSTEVVPARLVQALKERYAANAALFVDFTLFRAYRPMAIGVRAKIVDLSNMEVLWMADGILDAAEPDVAALASQFADSSLKMGYISPTSPKGQKRDYGSGNQVVLQSPRLFAMFVAHEAFASLAPLPPAVD